MSGFPAASARAPILFSRRRRRQQYQYRLPDWIWGLALGFVVLLFVGGYFLFTSLGGGGGGCGSPLPPLPGDTNVTAEGFQEEDRKLGETIADLQAGDIDNTFATFYGEVHAFTHNIDPNIRAVDEEMARELCELVIQVEEDYDPPPPEQRSLAKMRSSTEALRNYLRDVAEALGFPRPGG
ncbi:MAG: hypothetical protein ACE5JI_19520 [Acidobacteriota bacterium]